MHYRGFTLAVVCLVLASTSAPCNAAGPIRKLSQYAGTKSCKECHEEQYTDFIKSHHRGYVKKVSPETVIGDFEKNNTLKAGDYETRMIRRGDEFFVETIGPDGKPHQYRCEKTVGFHYKQRYETTLSDGRRYTLPVQWNKHEKRWVDYHGLTKEAPGSGSYWCDPERAVAVRCAGCHGTGIVLKYSKPNYRPKITSAEFKIGCEACHGPCAEHVRKPEETAASVDLRKLSHQRLTDVCGSCHNRGRDPVAGTAYPYIFYPGDRIRRIYNSVEPVIGKNTKTFWADRRALKHHEQYIEFAKSAHFVKAGMTCVTCHNPHSLKLNTPAGGQAQTHTNALCVSCHTGMKSPEKLKSHTHHDPQDEGSVCVNCHMPKLIKNEQPMQLHHHGFSKPNPYKTIKWDTPNACSICHHDEAKDETPRRMIEDMTEWGIPPEDVPVKLPETKADANAE